MSAPNDHDDIESLTSALRQIADRETGLRFMGWPDRWFDAHLRRCTNGHVSSTTLKSEGLGRDACLARGCLAPVTLTFPEDVDGPLLVPQQ